MEKDKEWLPMKNRYMITFRCGDEYLNTIYECENIITACMEFAKTSGVQTIIQITKLGSCNTLVSSKI